MEKITSKANDRIKFAVKIRESSSLRKQENLFFAEGARLCFDAASSGVIIAEMYVTEKALNKYADYVRLVEEKAERCFVVSEEVAEKLSDTKNSQGVFCLCKMLDKSTNIGKIKYNGKYIALESVSNPANFGAVVRTAEAVGLDGVIVSGGCDIYNPKSQRAAMGSLFRLNVVESENLPETLKALAENGMSVLAGVPDSNAEKITEVDMNGGVVAVIGNEGNGITEETCAVATKLVTIPMKGRAESLNAAAAASIIIWEMMR
ncbi:MAG: RNA methyltransferase [Ruminococcaceae bacterium]|nr:RNA methyltransferase [Oscillospiraceae bacterium]